MLYPSSAWRLMTPPLRFSIIDGAAAVPPPTATSPAPDQVRVPATLRTPVADAVPTVKFPGMLAVAPETTVFAPVPRIWPPSDDVPAMSTGIVPEIVPTSWTLVRTDDCPVVAGTADAFGLTVSVTPLGTESVPSRLAPATVRLTDITIDDPALE